MKTMAGVALAAVIACAGWAGSGGSAEAAQLYTVDYYFNLFYDTDDAPNFPYPYDVEIPVVLSGSVSNVKSGFSTTVDGISITIEFYSAIASFSAIGPYTLFGGAISGNLTAYSYLSKGSFGSYNADLVNGDYLFSYADYPGVFDAYAVPRSSGFITISAVPLPSSLPLFGAALLTVGGLAYARRRPVPNQAEIG